MMKNMLERYERLCACHGIRAKIVFVEDENQYKYIVEGENDRIITINTKWIPLSEVESVLAYAVSEILLPHLVLQTERLVIRRFRMTDAEACFPFMSDERGMVLDGCKPFAAMDEDYLERMRLFEERTGQYVITLKHTGEVVGTINVFADDSRAVESKEIGYAVSPAHQRKGYAFEALSAIVRLLQQDLMLDMVVAGVLPENTPSIRLLEKLGFSCEGLRHKALWHEGLERPVDLLYYYKDKDEG